MNIIRILYHTLFYSSSNLSIIAREGKNEGYAFDIQYKNSDCGSLYMNGKQVALIYSRGLHLFKGLIDYQNIEIKYHNQTLELYTKSTNRRILKAKCGKDVLETIQSELNTLLRS